MALVGEWVGECLVFTFETCGLLHSSSVRSTVHLHFKSIFKIRQHCVTPFNLLFLRFEFSISILTPVAGQRLFSGLHGTKHISFARQTPMALNIEVNGALVGHLACFSCIYPLQYPRLEYELILLSVL